MHKKTISEWPNTRMAFLKTAETIKSDYERVSGAFGSDEGKAERIDVQIKLDSKHAVTLNVCGQPFLKGVLISR